VAEVLVPDRGVAPGLRRQQPADPQDSRPHSPAWLALPADWQEHPVLRHTARELARMAGLEQLEG
jgi:hypothetical protein